MLKGDLNHLQDEALQHLIIEENQEKNHLEKERMKYTIFAANPEAGKFLYKDEEEDEEEENLEWITPKSIEDVEYILKDFARVQTQTQSFNDPQTVIQEKEEDREAT